MSRRRGTTPGHWATWPRRCVRRCVQGLPVGLLAGRIGPLARAWCCLWQGLRRQVQMPGEEEGGGLGLLVSLPLLPLLSLTQRCPALSCHQRQSGKDACGEWDTAGKGSQGLAPPARSRLGDMSSGRWETGRKVAKERRAYAEWKSNTEKLIMTLSGKF